ncbi:MULTISPECIES: MmgE/PrpD family protein [unclassified Mycobacterium]|uniref:MmgE/PrpD family protein n=1 Tax=unclassified Mycobacterium TaxID=2642494 RepID=UPI0029C6AFC3|nr:MULTISPECIES: MmgE/PrpD family protein [unclassified Mycobacterium]
MDAITAALTAYSTGLDANRLTTRDREAVAHRLIDSLACAYGGIDGPPVLALRRLAASRPLDGGCSAWGSAVRTTPELAALANGTALRYLDFNDYIVGGHPSDVIPAVVAACEWIDGTVADLVVAVTVSYEVFGELGRMLIRYRGWDQSTTAALAAACGVGRVLRLDAEQMASAIGMVATANIATGKARRGNLSMWKAVAGPYQARSGLLAAELAAAGVTAPHDAFAGEFGFLQQVSGDFEVERLDLSAGPRYVHATAEKHWPVHFDLQPAVWLGAKIRTDLGPDIGPDSIAEIRVETSEWTWKGTASDPAQWAPSNRESADHSLPYVLAVALSRGGIGHQDFAAEAVSSGDHLAWLDRITVDPAEDITARSTDFCTMRAVVIKADGTRHTFAVEEPRSKQMTEAERRAKWLALTRPSRLAAGSDELLRSLTRLDDRQRVRDLLAPLTRTVGNGTQMCT